MKDVTLIHFNDIYNVDRAPRFVHEVLRVQGKGPSFTIFSGDAFSPSILSTAVRGRQMVPVLKALNIDCACLGNHDLDFGIRDFESLRDQCGFPWICSNAKSLAGDEQLAGCKEYMILSRNNMRVLVFGLIESAWMETLASVDPEEVLFEDPDQYVNRRLPELENEHGKFDLVVASSHMRMPNDYKLADRCAGRIDIVLGGHDHHYEHSIREGIHILNSGTDFSDFTECFIKGRISERDGPTGRFCPIDVLMTRHTITEDIPEHPGVAEDVAKIQAIVEENMDKVIGRTKVDLDARFSQIRTRETNISNFLASVMARATDADIALLNSGSIRADRIIPKGDLTMRDLASLTPMADALAVVEISGEQLIEVLENGVSQYPAMEGRFPCLDGVTFTFDPSRAPGSRVIEDSVYVRERKKSARLRRSGDKEIESEKSSPALRFLPLDRQKVYKLCTKTYLLDGKDGYDVLAKTTIVQDEEHCPLLPTAVANLFTEICTLKRWTSFTPKATVIAAATKFKRQVRNSIVDPFAISPVVDGRIRNIEEN